MSFRILLENWDTLRDPRGVQGISRELMEYPAGLDFRGYLEGHRDLVSRLLTPYEPYSNPIYPHY